MDASGTTPPAGPPAAPLLAPGLRVVRRGPDRLQVGLLEGRRVLLPRTPTVERTLGLLLDRRPPDDDPGCAEVLAALDRNGCLVRTPPRRPPASTRVAVLGHLEPAGLPDAETLLVDSGLRVGPVQAADAVLVLGAGELDRDRLDPLIRRGTPHLVVRLLDGGAVLGPFVVPGRTACLRCIDAHLGVHDPEHVAVTARYVRATARARADGTPDLEPALVRVALAWAVRDLLAHLGGRQPSTWSGTLTWGDLPAPPTLVEWRRHPRCGCVWQPAQPPSGTMGT